MFVAPAAVAGIAALATLSLPALRIPGTPGAFDRAGAVLFGVTIAAAVTALGLGLGAGVPWWVPGALVLVAAASAAGLVRVERRAPDPAIPVDLLRIPAYRAYALATGAFMGMLVVTLTMLPQLASARRVGAGEAAVMLSLLTVPSAVLPLLGARLARRRARPLVITALCACTLTAAVLQVTSRPPALLAAAGVIGLSLGLTEGVPDGQALRYVPGQRAGAGAALFSTARMSLETLTLAAATGGMAAFGPAAGMAAAGAITLTTAAVAFQTVPASET